MEKICKICDKNIKAHSFSHLGVYDTNSYIFYSKISDAKLYDDYPGVINHFTNYLNLINPDKWIWIVDYKSFGLKHYFNFRVNIGLAKLIKKFGKIDRIIIINSNNFFNKTLNILKPLLGNDILNKTIIYNKNEFQLFIDQLNVDLQIKIFLLSLYNE